LIWWNNNDGNNESLGFSTEHINAYT